MKTYKGENVESFEEVRIDDKEWDQQLRNLLPEAHRYIFDLGSRDTLNDFGN